MKPAHSQKCLWGGIALAGLLAAISFYYVWHKPFTLMAARNVLTALAQTTCAAGILLVSGGIGKRLTRQLDWQTHPWVALSIEATLGLGATGLGVLVAGWLVGVQAWLAWLALAALGWIFRIDMLAWAKQLKAGLAGVTGDARLANALALLAVWIAGLTWFTAAAPPLKFDALVYHLALPLRYLSTAIPESSAHFFWGMPQVGEMAYTWAAALGGGGVEAAALLGWMGALAAVMGLTGWMKDRFGVRAAWVSAASLLCGFTLAASLAWGYVDWTAFACGLGALIVLEAWAEKRDRRMLLLAGALAGLGIGAKYSAGALWVGGMAVLLWQNRRRTIRELAMYSLAFSASALLVFAPWLLKNLISVGNPLYPFFIPTTYVDAWRLGFYVLPPAGGWMDAVTLPIQAAITGVEGAPGYAASIGPLLLALAPFAWLQRRTQAQRNALHVAAFLAGVGLLVWMVAGRFSAYLAQSRLHLAFFPAFAILAGAGFAGLDHIKIGGARLGRVAGALIAAVMAFSAVELTVHTLRQGAIQRLAGITSDAAYLGDNLGWFAPAMEAVGGLQGERVNVLMLWEPRSLYCLPRCTPDETLDRWKRDWRAYGNVEAILASWRSAGVTHVLYYRFGADYVRGSDDRYSVEEWHALDDLLKKLGEGEDFGGAYLLYALGEPGS
ncbi:MAG: glycosyltransferase family 39 protein [Chloroflexi bacterium]|nr:glycosyltransferase family 39 protein [Chloroflexota bacterium]